MSDESELTRAARDQLKPLSPEICLPFKSDEDPFGLLLVGLKSGGEPYTANDIQLLTLLAKNLSLIINQLRLKLQVMQAEELELLGRMSRGMAHDLNNLLTPVSTFLQLCGLDGGQGSSRDLLPVVMRNVKTMQAYIQDSLFFSQHNTPNFQHSRLDSLLEKAVGFAETRLKRKRVTVSIDAPSEIMVEMDEVLIQRLIGNLLANAIDASPAEGSIRMELCRLAKTESQRDWVRLRIIDFGEGISRENLQRIQAPYFTTKDHGDESRGFGLGLSICRKIIHLHGGHLNIFSEVRKGTTVQVDLPSHQLQRTSAPKTVTG
jgi:signal transduction histidine kinase